MGRVDLELISMFHHPAAQILCRFCQVFICQSRTGQTVELVEQSQPSPGFRPPGPPCIPTYRKRLRHIRDPAHLDRVWVPVEVFGLPHDGLLAVELLLGHVEQVAVVVDQVLAHVSLGRRPGKVGGALKVGTNNILHYRVVNVVVY